MEEPTMSKSLIITNPHPGDILAEDLLAPLGLSQNALARAIGVPPRRINEIVHGKRAITADTGSTTCLSACRCA